MEDWRLRHSRPASQIIIPFLLHISYPQTEYWATSISQGVVLPWASNCWLYNTVENHVLQWNGLAFFYIVLWAMMKRTQCSTHHWAMKQCNLLESQNMQRAPARPLPGICLSSIYSSHPLISAAQPQWIWNEDNKLEVHRTNPLLTQLNQRDFTKINSTPWRDN